MYISDNNIEIHEPKNDRKFQYSSLNLLKKKEKFSKYVEDLNNTMYKLNNWHLWNTAAYNCCTNVLLT